MARLKSALDYPRGTIESSTMRAARLRARMARFKAIYNAAWFVRAAQHGAPANLQKKIKRLMNALRRELENCQDDEALLYAIADALTADSRLPWEG